MLCLLCGMSLKWTFDCRLSSDTLLLRPDWTPQIPAPQQTWHVCGLDTSVHQMLWGKRDQCSWVVTQTGGQKGLRTHQQHALGFSHVGDCTRLHSGLANPDWYLSKIKNQPIAMQKIYTQDHRGHQLPYNYKSMHQFHLTYLDKTPYVA